MYPRTSAVPKVDGMNLAEVRSVAEAVELALERSDGSPKADDHAARRARAEDDE